MSNCNMELFLGEWRHSLCSNLGGIDPEKPNRATLKNEHALNSFNYHGTCSIGHFRVSESLCFKARLTAKQLI